MAIAHSGAPNAGDAMGMSLDIGWSCVQMGYEGGGVGGEDDAESGGADCASGSACVPPASINKNVRRWIPG
jgi:hypothetical protein